MNPYAIDPATAKFIAQVALKIATDEEARKKVIMIALNISIIMGEACKQAGSGGPVWIISKEEGHHQYKINTLNPQEIGSESAPFNWNRLKS